MENKSETTRKGVRNIIILGLISCFADISSEMVYPLIPLYLTTAFGATPALVGIIEGIAESVASLLKVFSGYISDRFQHKKAIAFCGYATGVLYKIALLFAGSWAGVLTARVIDRFGQRRENCAERCYGCGKRRQAKHGKSLWYSQNAGHGRIRCGYPAGVPSDEKYWT